MVGLSYESTAFNVQTSDDAPSTFRGQMDVLLLATAAAGVTVMVGWVVLIDTKTPPAFLTAPATLYAPSFSSRFIAEDENVTRMSSASLRSATTSL